MKTNKKEDFFEHDNLNDEEKKKAKQNGFILVGKTGTGKTTILNAIFNKIVGKAESTAKSVTKITSIYYYKLKNG
jgi:DNA replication protein DnaC